MDQNYNPTEFDAELRELVPKIDKRSANLKYLEFLNGMDGPIHPVVEGLLCRIWHPEDEIDDFSLLRQKFISLQNNMICITSKGKRLLEIIHDN